MKNINITEEIINELKDIASLKSISLNVITFMLDDNFDRLLGNHELSENDLDIIKLRNNKSIEPTETIEISTMTFGTIIVNLSGVNNNAFVSAYHDDNRIMTITADDRAVRNNVIYEDENNNTIELTKEVNYRNNDICSFNLTRNENNEVVYQGSLNPVLASMGNKEFFDFSSCLSNKKQSDSLMQKVFNSFTSGSLVGITTGRGTTDLSYFTDVIYNTLENKLEEARKKQTTKAKTRTK